MGRDRPGGKGRKRFFSFDSLSPFIFVVTFGADLYDVSKRLWRWGPFNVPFATNAGAVVGQIFSHTVTIGEALRGAEQSEAMS